MSKRLFKVLVLSIAVTVFLGMFAGCQAAPAPSSQSATQQASSASSTEASSTPASSEETSSTSAKVNNIVFIIKAQDSEFFQIAQNGAKAAAAELGSKVNVTYQAVVSSTDNEGQVSLFQNVLTSHPDAIVIAPMSQGTSALFQQAVDEGIKLVLMDANYDFNNYTSFLSSDNVVIGQTGAQAMVDALEAAGKPLTGSVGIICAGAGIPTLIDRCNGFTDKLKEIAPNIELLPIKYCDVDMTKVVSTTQDVYNANQDTLIGLYGDCNFSGDGMVQGITEGKLQGKFIVVTTDSDPIELQAIKDGIIQATIVQDAYAFGYQGVMSAYNALIGESVQKDIKPTSTTVTLENLNDPAVQKIISPETASPSSSAS